ncbi:nitrate reductase [Antarcticirhabdus aurantiaca]|uniref:Molybdopterin-dependent oxidoreductase n=1 Tax=Antarcticirhabdus aurantiaca TaxID=2606717 RepID=A0ACD4NTY1_9HYPH|nr:nitrate reductase [Antarcticirhabdus aurantiaca]WAJ30169.1 molybdopterin-dependent oxidoreductase [Jeongeuplla avenae]
MNDLAQNATPPTRTTCPYCGVGCGVLASPMPDGSVSIAGDPDHPANLGRLCSKGAALGETVGLEERLLHPAIEGERVSWDAALTAVAERFSAAVRDHGPDAVAFYCSGQLLTEDYYVANKLMKGFIGSANIDTNSRLCMSSSVAGHVRAFGADHVPVSYEDMEAADLVVLVGSNLAWCHPVLYQRLVAAKAARPAMRVVVIDPRRSATCDIADLHLALAADGDVPLFLGLLAHLHRAGATDPAFLDAHTTGFGAALGEALALTACDLEAATGLSAPDLLAFFDLVAQTPRTVTLWSQGANQSASGTDKVNAIVNCHLATGRIGKPGAGPFSITGQPNAMGGREVGGLANMLAAHMAIENPAHREIVRTFWNAPSLSEKPGLKAVDLFRAVADGRIKALWIMGTNPVVSMPDADAIKAALAACPFVVVSEASATADTLAFAHVALPAAAWGEKNGTVTNSERRISRQRPFLDMPGEARPDWWILSAVARRMGFRNAFAYHTPAEIFAEHAALTAFRNEAATSRDLDLGALAGLDAAAYEALAPLRWPLSARAAAPARSFADGRFFHADGRARLVPVAPPKRDAASGFTLNTGRVRDHWHTMTRTGLSPRLSAHIAEPFLEIHPEDAAALGLADADLARLSSPHGEATLRCLVTDRGRRGAVFAPMHWTAAYAPSGRVDALVEPRTDPVSGQPALKASRVSVERYPAAWYGFLVSTRKPEPLSVAGYHALARTRGGWRAEIAGATRLADPAAVAAALLGAEPTEPGLLSYDDAATGSHRFALVRDGRLDGALWLSPQPVAVSRAFAAEKLGATLTALDRARLLAGRGGADGPDKGAIVCSCMNIGANDILAAMAKGAVSVEAVAAQTRAGTNCGSCRSEIRALLARAAEPRETVQLA